MSCLAKKCYTSQDEVNALLGCRRGFVNPLTTNFLVARGVMLRGDAAEFVNNYPYLLFGLQHCLRRRKL